MPVIESTKSMSICKYLDANYYAHIQEIDIYIILLCIKLRCSKIDNVAMKEEEKQKMMYSPNNKSWLFYIYPVILTYNHCHCI